MLASSLPDDTDPGVNFIPFTLTPMSKRTTWATPMISKSPARPKLLTPSINSLDPLLSSPSLCAPIHHKATQNHPGAASSTTVLRRAIPSPPVSLRHSVGHRPTCIFPICLADSLACPEKHLSIETMHFPTQLSTTATPASSRRPRRMKPMTPRSPTSSS